MIPPKSVDSDAVEKLYVELQERYKSELADPSTRKTAEKEIEKKLCEFIDRMDFTSGLDLSDWVRW